MTGSHGLWRTGSKWRSVMHGEPALGKVTMLGLYFGAAPVRRVKVTFPQRSSEGTSSMENNKCTSLQRFWTLFWCHRLKKIKTLAMISDAMEHENFPSNIFSTDSPLLLVFCWLLFVFSLCKSHISYSSVTDISSSSHPFALHLFSCEFSALSFPSWHYQCDSVILFSQLSDSVLFPLYLIQQKLK